MTKEMRERIEKGIRGGESLKEIADAIDKDPTTICKGVLKHRNKVIKDLKHNTVSSFCSKCFNFPKCDIVHLCKTQGCSKKCKSCSSLNPTLICSLFNEIKCKRLTRFPYVCNECHKRLRCQLEKYEYVPITAQRTVFLLDLSLFFNTLISSGREIFTIFFFQKKFICFIFIHDFIHRGGHR